MSNKKKIQKPYPISWEQLHRDARALAWRLLEKDFFTGIVAVTRGGLVPAAIIARELDIHMVETVCIAGYDWQEHRGEPEVLKAPDMDGSGWLLIDDLVDSGQTAALVRKTLPKAYFACIYAKPSGRPQVDCYVTEVSQDTWILFPWDMESRFVEPLAGNI